MSLTHTSLDQTQPEIQKCTRCSAELPPSATFCGHCGERVEKNSGEKSSPKNADITDRYRITSLLRRQLPTQVLLALDTQQQRPVVIHDVDISNLDEEARAQAIAALQTEYDLLRRQRIPAIMPLVDLRYFNGHVSIIASWPFALTKEDAETTGAQYQHISTLQDLLQSGMGLPEEQIAIAWISRLSRALEQIHRLDIFSGNLDPQTILMSHADFTGEPMLAISWLPDTVRELLPQPLHAANPSHFSAPEVQLGATEPRSDIYSLGAILYLLLTGVTPADANKRQHRPLPSLQDRNPRANSTLDMVVMQALALEPEQRFQCASEFTETLQQFLPQTRGTRRTGQAGMPITSAQENIYISSNAVDNRSDKDNEDLSGAELADKTISIVPLQARMARRYLSRIQTNKLGLQEQSIGEAIVEKGLTQQKQANEKKADEKLPTSKTKQEPQTAQPVTPTTDLETPVTSEQNQAIKTNTSAATDESSQAPTAVLPEIAVSTENREMIENAVPTQDITQLATVLIKSDTISAALAAYANTQEQTDNKPIVPESVVSESPKTSKPSEKRADSKDTSLAHLKEIITGSFPIIPRLLHAKDTQTAEHATDDNNLTDESILKRMQRFILGEPQQSTSAAALIETPMRIQPNQGYSIRVNVMGRNTSSDTNTGGLSALGEGETVHIEVRSALYQNYAYIVQQADVRLPAAGYVAEITMPMQPLSSGPSGRRERLHIFFMDEHRSPLYEKPFVIELFISHLVQSGREGHNVLSIPL